MIKGKIEFECYDEETAKAIVRMLYEVCRSTPGVMAWGSIEGDDDE